MMAAHGRGTGPGTAAHWEAQPPVVAHGAAAALRTRPLPQPTASSLVVESFFFWRLTLALVMAACSRVTLMWWLGLMPLRGLLLLSSASRTWGCVQPHGQPLDVGLPSGLQCLVPYPYRARASLNAGASTAPTLRLKPVPPPSWPISLTRSTYACCMYKGSVVSRGAETYWPAASPRQ
jgi:hypothetical protein